MLFLAGYVAMGRGELSATSQERLVCPCSGLCRSTGLKVPWVGHAAEEHCNQHEYIRVTATTPASFQHQYLCNQPNATLYTPARASIPLLARHTCRPWSRPYLVTSVGYRTPQLTTSTTHAAVPTAAKSAGTQRPNTCTHTPRGALTTSPALDAAAPAAAGKVLVSRELLVLGSCAVVDGLLVVDDVRTASRRDALAAAAKYSVRSHLQVQGVGGPMKARPTGRSYALNVS